ncbi:MAG: AMIN domain-containing protein [Ruminococcaceae bacterium]|nr:AMIN domain-containing protein [Oscillospiraceae bacterium]
MNKKNIIALLLVLFFLFNIVALLIPVFINAAGDITVLYDDKELKSDVSPVIYNDRVLVPARMIFEAMGAEIGWAAKERRVTIQNGKDTFIFHIDSPVVFVNGTKHQLDTRALLISDRTFIPLRFLVEKSGMKVEWVDKTRTVKIDSGKASSTDKEGNSSASDKNNADNDKNTSGSDKTEYNYLTSVKLDESSATVNFKTSSVKYEYFTLKSPTRLVIDIEDCIKGYTTKDPTPDSDYFTAFRCAQFSKEPMVTRLVFELDGDSAYQIDVEKNMLTVEFFHEDENVVYKEPKHNSKYKTVVIDAGHGGKDPGAVGTENGVIVLKEKDVNLKIALKVYAKLKNEKVNVYMTRSTDKFLELSEIVDFANKKKADLLVSVHNNASENTSTSGTMTMYAYNTAKTGYKLSGKTVAETIQKYLVKATKGKDYGPRQNSALYILRKSNMPAVITESLFVTNKSDRAKLKNETYINNIADAIYKGICDVMDLD